jgi:UDP-N-acetylmuramoyl-tripeptide--D-alanyl-D-alanine ligase
VRGTAGNYNNEFGVPLTIIGMESGGMSPLKWLKVMYHATKLLVFTMPYPEVLILEMGADAPGDIDYLTDIAPLSIGVFTAVGEAHLHKLGSLEGVSKEKEKIITKLKGGRAVVNGDDSYVMKSLLKYSGNRYTYGFKEGNDIQALEIHMVGMEDAFCESQSEWECKVWGTGFKVRALGSIVPFFLPAALGHSNVYAALAAIGVGLEMGMNLVDISESLHVYRPPKGRTQILAGIKGTMIIDGTYNAAPVAVKDALRSMAAITPPQGGRKWAFLGSMLELGKQSEMLHVQIGRYAVEMGVDALVCVGSEARMIGQGAQEAGMDEAHIYYEDTSEGVGNKYQQYIQKNDLILVKGSQGARMEKIVKEIMQDPLKAEKLLVRQSKKWL